MAAEIRPDLIAQRFIKQYYEFQASKPELLYRFFKEDSSFSFIDGPQPTEPACGVQAINTRVKEIEFAGSSVDLSEGSIDAQKSDPNSYLIVITGEFKFLNKAPRPFVQTFILAGHEQNNSTSFYCRNSVLRFLSLPSLQQTSIVTPSTHNTEAPHQVVKPVESSKSHVETLHPVVTQPVAHVEPVKEPEVVDEVSHEEEPEETPETVEQEEPEAVAEPEIEECEEEIVEEIVETFEPVEEEQPKGPRSYLDMVKRGTKPTPAPVTTTTKVIRKVIKTGTKPTASAAPITAPADTTTTTTTPAPHTKSSDHGTVGHGKSSSGGSSQPRIKQHVSLYIRGVPTDATKADFEALLEPFGLLFIKNIDVLNDKNIAFVDIDNDTTLKKILSKTATDPFIINGSTLKVEEKKPSLRKMGGGGDGYRGGRGSAGGDKGGRRDRPATGSGEKSGDYPRKNGQAKSGGAKQNSSAPPSKA